MFLATMSKDIPERHADMMPSHYAFKVAEPRMRNSRDLITSLIITWSSSLLWRSQPGILSNVD